MAGGYVDGIRVGHTRRHVLRRTLLATALVVSAVLGAGPALTAAAAVPPGERLGPWVSRSSWAVPSGVADQGVAVRTLAGRTAIVLRGGADIPDPLSDGGWVHVGDPDSRAGVLVDAYQASASTRYKEFVVTRPDGRSRAYLHTLVAGETYHNSFAALSPDLRWLVSGEWGTMRRLLVFPVPGFNAAAPATRPDLPLATMITLAHPVRDVQGCVFASTVSLLCSTNDPGAELYGVPRQLLGISLAHPLDGTADLGTPALVGSIPQDPTCPAPGEVEGLDLHGTTLRIAVNSSCRPVTLVTTFVPAPGTAAPRR